MYFLNKSFLFFAISLISLFPNNIKPVFLNEPTSIKYSNGEMSVNLETIAANKNLGALKDNLVQTKLIPFYKANQIPDFIKSFIEQLSGSKFTIANSGEDWQCCDAVIDESLPERLLIYGGKSDKYYLLTYLTGGVGEVTHILIIKYNQKLITNFYTCTTPKKLDNKNSILEYLTTIEKKRNVLYISKNKLFL
ncbi:hypothetical protein [Mucilaginibacter agri]|uniref:Uncharacterized protein n=1 Tax=Mucilaginibacter agri TaxID=2695265 RepID=A0A965ZKC7_9SPHI|nr:hypothetical protein [Mucilaginibacter agri]NCD71623.1 hypothetical protein [Mucilaginibacter agri]